MHTLAAVLLLASILAMLVGFIANPLVALAFVAMWVVIYKIGRWLEGENPAPRRRDPHQGL